MKKAKRKKTMDILKDASENLGDVLSRYYDQAIINALTYPDIRKYRKVKVPKYLTVKIPTISKDFDDDYEYGDGGFKGILISLREIKLFRIGTKIEKQPIMRKTKGQTIKFARYGEK